MLLDTGSRGNHHHHHHPRISSRRKSGTKFRAAVCHVLHCSCNVNATVADSLHCRMICGTVPSPVHAWMPPATATTWSPAAPAAAHSKPLPRHEQWEWVAYSHSRRLSKSNSRSLPRNSYSSQVTTFLRITPTHETFLPDELYVIWRVSSGGGPRGAITPGVPWHEFFL